MFRVQVSISKIAHYLAGWSNEMDLALILQFSKHLIRAIYIKFYIVLYLVRLHEELGVRNFTCACLFELMHFQILLESSASKKKTRVFHKKQFSLAYTQASLCIQVTRIQRQLPHGTDTVEIHLVKKILNMIALDSA